MVGGQSVNGSGVTSAGISIGETNTAKPRETLFHLLLNVSCNLILNRVLILCVYVRTFRKSITNSDVFQKYSYLCGWGARCQCVTASRGNALHIERIGSDI